MRSKISYSTKNKLLGIAIILFILLAYNLAIKKTVAAATLNEKLKKIETGEDNLSSSPEFTKHKLSMLNNALSLYKTSKEDWENGFWLKASGIAERYNTRVKYEPEREAVADTIAAFQSQRISFSGNFISLVQVLDSLSDIQGLGRMSSIEIIKNQGQKRDERNLDMHIVFHAVVQ